ncbi:ethanolamine utilization protein EutQ [Pseudomonas sp. P5_152]|uniref:ethanolamine utilization protein EutQ n=1 Tax=unclassified Pseudomonas TaxID=196821 RepID=UPI000BA3DDA5|nr:MULTISPECIES: ethanolamine utilization protein EutQ [unclassified Pseudomonas]MDX9663966.1 ethanolamine utilization protein EutQ [Pseudomonas sp. P5_152]QHD01975.1 ethanolamine utilization protein EutQ [Pseudomonas sp. S04]QHF34458.1 ethanolamine utilization protein EutQ [Pseudomonas sp. S19]
MSPRAPGKARVLCIDQQDLTFTVRGGPPGAAYVARAVSNEVSPNIGVGFARWEGAEVRWTVLYDEVIFVIEGCLQLQADGEMFEVRPGQVLWIPEGSELVYGGHALFGYVVHPGNWKELHGLA